MCVCVCVPMCARVCVCVCMHCLSFDFAVNEQRDFTSSSECAEEKKKEGRGNAENWNQEFFLVHFIVIMSQGCQATLVILLQEAKPVNLSPISQTTILEATTPKYWAILENQEDKREMVLAALAAWYVDYYGCSTSMMNAKVTWQWGFFCPPRTVWEGSFSLIFSRVLFNKDNSHLLWHPSVNMPGTELLMMGFF